MLTFPNEMPGWSLIAHGNVIRGDEENNEEQIATAVSPVIAREMVLRFNLYPELVKNNNSYELMMQDNNRLNKALAILGYNDQNLVAQDQLLESIHNFAVATKNKKLEDECVIEREFIHSIAKKKW